MPSTSNAGQPLICMKNRTLTAIFLAFFPIFLHAQQYQAGIAALQAQRFPEAIGFFQQAGKQLPPLLELGMARYFSAPENPGFHLDSAYTRVLAGLQAYRSLEDRKQEAVKKELGNNSAVKIKRQIEKLWFSEVMAKKDLLELNRFLTTTKNALSSQMDSVSVMRDQLAFEEAANKNTQDAYYQLLLKYGPSLRSTHPTLFQKAGMRLLEQFIDEKGWAQKSAFKTIYPEASFALDTILTAVKTAGTMAARNRQEGWESFIRRYQGTFFEPIGMDSLSAFILQKGDLPKCVQYLKSWPNSPNREQVWERIYLIYRQMCPDPYCLQSFAALYPEFPFPERLKEDAKTALEFFYKATMRSDSVGRIVRFLQSYPAYPSVDSIWLRYYTLVRAQAKTPAEIEAFIKAKPGMPAAIREIALQEKKAWEDRIQQQAFDRLVSAGHPTPLLQYATKQPPLKFAKEAKEKLPQILLKSDSVEVMRTFLKVLPDHPARPDVLERLYTISGAYRNLDSINAFVAAYPDFDSVRIKGDRGAIFNKVLFSNAYTEEQHTIFSRYVKEYAPSDEAFFVLQKMLYKDFAEGNFPVVLDTMVQYASYFGQKNSAFQDFYHRLQQEELPKKLSPLVWADGKEYDGYSPELSGDGKQLYFTRRYILGETEDIYYTQYSENGWSVPMPVSSLNTQTNNEAAEHISTNGTEILLFVSGDIYESKRTANGWQKPKRLPDQINTSSWECDSRYFGGGLIYVSTKGGDTDIYVARYGANGTTLQNPFSLGDVINTSGTERNPFLHPDMKTLYFSSNGHNGFGGFDIFVSTRLDDTWRNWSKPRNLGLMFNSGDNDWHFTVTTDGSKAFSTWSHGSTNRITYMDLPEAYKPEPVYTFETKVVDANGKPLDGEVAIQDLETGAIVQIVRPDPVTGAVFIPLSEKKNYRAELRKANAPPVSIQLNFAQDTAKGIVEKPVVVSTTEDLIQSGASLVLNNLFFETGSYTLLDQSRFELDALSKYLHDNQLRIEIQGHTDDVGSAESNRLLSENRASAVRDYLIAKGCDPEKVKATGFGETRPSVPNTDEKSRQKNRRVEFRLL